MCHWLWHTLMCSVCTLGYLFIRTKLSLAFIPARLSRNSGTDTVEDPLSSAIPLPQWIREIPLVCNPLYIPWRCKSIQAEWIPVTRGLTRGHGWWHGVTDWASVRAPLPFHPTAVYRREAQALPCMGLTQPCHLSRRLSYSAACIFTVFSLTYSNQTNQTNQTNPCELPFQGGTVLG